jgi:type I restriction enzyme S subunit
MNKLSKYPSYKDSYETWIQEIPEYWSVFRLKHVFSITKRIVGELGHDVLSITQKGIKVKDTISGVGQLSMDYSKYQQVDRGDFAMNHMDLLTGFVDISKYDGVISPDYRVFKLAHSESDSRFLLYILQLSYTQRIFFKHGKGVSMLGRWRLPAENFKNFIIPIPPREEQTKIAAFLDYKLAKIDRFILKKKQLIKLLNEQKAAIINQAVTKGLDPNAKMKPSGIEWLGDIPEHWEVWRLKYLINCRLKYGANEPGGDLKENDPRYIRITDFDKSGKLRDDTFCSLDNELAESYLLKDGDILFARSGGTVGKTFQFKNYDGVACYAGYLIKAEPNEKLIYSDYLFEFTNSGVYDSWKSFIFNKATIENIGADKYSQLPVILPPQKEQLKIFVFIKNETKTINKTISTIEKEITLTQEYKTALIAEAVTGKIDVRDFVIPETLDEETYEDLEEELSLAAEGEDENQNGD